MSEFSQLTNFKNNSQFAYTHHEKDGKEELLARVAEAEHCVAARQVVQYQRLEGNETKMAG